MPPQQRNTDPNENKKINIKKKIKQLTQPIRFLLFLIGVLMFFYLIYIVYLFIFPPKTSDKKFTGLAAPVVSVMKLQLRDWSPALQVTGNITAAKSVQVSSETAGMVDVIHFDSGQWVSQAQPLVALEDKEVKAALQKVEAKWQGDLKYYKRIKTLLNSHVISVADVDNALTKVKEDEADVAAQKALLAQHHIVAPFSGVVGIRQVEKGQYVNAGQPLVNLEQLDPVYVDFNVPERLIKQIVVGATVHVKVIAYPDKLFTGAIAATSNALNVETRSMTVRATMANPKKELLSGMSAQVMVIQPSRNNIVVPQSALAYDPGGVGVFVVDEKNIARWRYVTVGPRYGEDAVILAALKPGEKVVIAGQQKLQDGIEVAVR